MSRRPLDQDLAAVRGLLAVARDRVGDLDNYWLNSARRRLESIDELLIRAAGGLGGWTRTAIGACAMLGGALAAGVVTRALGMPTFWVVACSWVVAAVVELPVRRWTARRSVAIARRRLGRAARTVASTPLDETLDLPEMLDRDAATGASTPPEMLDRDATTAASTPPETLDRDAATAATPPDGPPDPPQMRDRDAATVAATPVGGLADLPDVLGRARVRLVSAALRQVGSKRWRVPYLRRAVAVEPAMFFLSRADELLCQSIDYLEEYLAADRKEPE
jgi:hypothetical protein